MVRYRWRGEQIRWKVIYHLYDGKGSADNLILSIFEDKTGNLWFGTDRRREQIRWKIVYHLYTKQGLANNRVLGILKIKWETYGLVRKTAG